MRLVFATFIMVLGNLIPLTSHAAFSSCSVSSVSTFIQNQQIIFNKKEGKKKTEKTGEEDEEEEEPDCEDD